MTLPSTQQPLAATTQTDDRVHIQPGFLWDQQAAYLFDIDGTLLRCRDRIHVGSFFSGVRAVMGQELVLDGVILSGNTDPGILHDAFRLAKLEEHLWQPHLEAILENMRVEVASRRHEMQIAMMPGVEDTLAHLQKKGAALGVATGNLEAIGWLKIEFLGLRHWFTFGGFSDNFALRADMIAHAAKLAREHSGPEATVCVVGDTPSDISAARANGLPTIAVATGSFSFDDLMQYEPEVCATSLSALLRVTSKASA
ncbi:HAD family hydrolase [Silvibacterium dinghuense]|uniref:phosphoglycolate phosphatase n=1 Tax=Silvibacterium dinghuense TaxID=1560006 RepID=A0A4Q1SDA9_9BACT|nr:HAD family hydrolase [Silvibacterium dinghuense]RXS95031.1 HAD family hydrolase [Silvibacterium dinghuense]GGH10003.1 haloacid dehalogenase [Silvibacterium dinghuense]